MVFDNHSECKTAVIGLLDALGRIKTLTDAEGSWNEAQKKMIRELATVAIDRHSPILPKF